MNVYNFIACTLSITLLCVGVCVIRILEVAEDDIKALKLKPFLKALASVKEPEHDIAGYALIKSFAGCKKQAPHTDYWCQRSNGKVRDVCMPYSGVVSLQCGSSLLLGHDNDRVKLPVGSAIIFRGDVVHSGSDYRSDNVRFHFYIDVKGKCVASEGIHVRWV